MRTSDRRRPTASGAAPPAHGLRPRSPIAAGPQPHRTRLRTIDKKASMFEGKRPTASGVHAILAVALLISAACSGNSEPSAGGGSGTGGGRPGQASLPSCPIDALTKANGPVEVVVWHTLQAKPLDTVQALVDKYNGSQSRVRVRLESQGTNYEEIQKAFNNGVRSKQLPAILAVDDTFTQSMADSGVILPAQSCIKADNYDTTDLVKVAVDYYTIDGVLWPASANIGNVLLYYNRNHFRRAGLDPEKPPTTLAEVREYAQKIKTAGVTDKPFVHEFSAWKTEFFLTGDHSTVVDNDNGRGPGATDKATLAGNAQATELLQWFEKMSTDGLMNAIPYAPGQINQYLAMAQQKGSMVIESSSAATSIEAFLGGDLDPSSVGGGGLENADVSQLDISAGVMPGMRTPGKTQMGGGAWYMTNTNPPEVQAAAWDFIKFLNGTDAQVEQLVGGSALPFRASAASTPRATEFFSASLSGRWLKLANDQVQKIDPAFPGPLIGPYDQFRVELQRATDDLLFKGSTPSAALEGAQENVDKALTKYDEGL